MRRQWMLPGRAAHKVGNRVADPCNHQRKKQQPGTVLAQAVQPHRKGQRERHEEQSARTDSRSRQRFHQRTFRPKRQDRNAHHENKKCFGRSEQPDGKSSDHPMKYQTASKLVARFNRRNPLHVHEQKRAGRGPEAIGAMANRVPERKILK